MNFKKWVKSIQSTGYNGAHMVSFNFHKASKGGVMYLVFPAIVIVFSKMFIP